jgi:hypothetical protein
LIHFFNLKVSGTEQQLTATPVIDEAEISIPAITRFQLDVASTAYKADEIDPKPTYITAGKDISDTQPVTTIPILSLGLSQPFEIVLRNSLQEAMHSGGVEQLAEKGFTLVPNELAIYIVGRADSSLLAPVARVVHQIARTIGTQTDARRFAFLISTPPNNEIYASPGQDPGEKTWKTLVMGQPWRSLLSWQQGEPPLHYAFFYEAWDEASRYHSTEELHYILAEALYAIFTTGILDQAQFKDSLDFSSASLDSSGGLNRLGSIGAVQITNPSLNMIDYLARRFAADVLIRRGLMSVQTKQSSPLSHKTFQQEAKEDAEKWLQGMLRSRLIPGNHPLPSGLPPRELGDGQTGEWTGLMLSTASPDPAPLLWRWTGMGLYLDDERFWNSVLQNDWETARETRKWEEGLSRQLVHRGGEVANDLENAIRWRTLGPNGAERARSFAIETSNILRTESQLLTEAKDKLSQDLDVHHRVLEDDLRHTHSHRGVPQRPNPPEHDKIPYLPRNMEAISHEVIANAFKKVPMPWTLITTGLLLALVGALFTHPIAKLPFIPNEIRSILNRTEGWAWGTGVMLFLFSIMLIPFIFNAINLRRWQKRYRGERMVLWLSYAKERERVRMEAIVENVQHEADLAQQHIDSWTRGLEESANKLNQQALLLRKTVSSAPLTRDVFVAQGKIWESNNPDQLYLSLRQQIKEEVIIDEFLRYMEAHAGTVIISLKQDTIGSFALDFMSDYLRRYIESQPFTMWDAATTGQALDRALSAAKVPMQPQVAGHPLSSIEYISASTSIPWIPRMAEERSIVLIPSSQESGAIVMRVVTRARHILVNN